MNDKPITDLDRKIIRAIQDGNNHSRLINKVVDMDNCRRDRMLSDRRRQSLRRRGLIQYTGQARVNGWKLPTEQRA